MQSVWKNWPQKGRLLGEPQEQEIQDRNLILDDIIGILFLLIQKDTNLPQITRVIHILLIVIPLLFQNLIPLSLNPRVFCQSKHLIHALRLLKQIDIHDLLKPCLSQLIITFYSWLLPKRSFLLNLRQMYEQIT